MQFSVIRTRLPVFTAICPRQVARLSFAQHHRTPCWTFHLQALRIELVACLASTARLAASRASISRIHVSQRTLWLQTCLHSPLATALCPLGGAVSARVRRSCWGATRPGSGSSCGPGRRSLSTTRAVGELAFDESESSLAIDLAIALVDVGVVAGAAIWVCAVAVALDFACGLETMSVRDLRIPTQHRLTEQLYPEGRAEKPWVRQVPTW